MTEKEKKQVKMHMNFFDQCELAIENGYYLEAIMMEYAAIESRLESICGVLGLPCGQRCPCRRDIKISDRIQCLRVCRNKNQIIFANTKLPETFFCEKGELKTWIRGRDIRVHGLFKSEEEFFNRIAKNEKLAKTGLTYARLLYNEAKRLRRLSNHVNLFNNTVLTCKKGIKCNAYKGV